MLTYITRFPLKVEAYQRQHWAMIRLCHATASLFPMIEAYVKSGPDHP